MPTPSSPGPQPPYTIAATCPDPEDQQTAQHPSTSWHTRSDAYNHTDDVSRRAVRHSSLEQDVDASPSSTRSPLGGQSLSSDGPTSDMAAISPSITDSQGRIDQHAVAETDDERTDSPCDVTSSESLHLSRPRHGVGTGVPSGFDADMHISTDLDLGTEEDYALPSMGHGFPSKRIIPASPSTYLRAGSRFTGTQQSERQVYEVQVEIKYVDLRESFLCGYLRIQGLTDDHPTLTTYFEGEIIGNKYGFMTKHESWGANDKTDLSHWSKFPAFRPYSKQARRGSAVVLKDIAQSEHIFMRWKEHFLVPDHRVRTISGASFEGFYYICFNQVQGEINGIYFHSKSERFQQLELKHVEDKGCYSALEFR
ncbi:hypothetical protein diail_11861 [Diaporthe ilicicola]|nr:hypothetical protein diail_11861 [Diaporthe ilicicola]